MQPNKKQRSRKKILLGLANLAEGERQLVEVAGKSIGIFNVAGEYFSLHNRCPHMGGNLCAGPVTGTAVPTDGTEFVYARQGEIIRCAWHGWEFEIKTGQSLVDEKLRARCYEITVENGQLFIHI
jgi:nitrite reductase/ring-hydroxylating ferredoxin subunit